MAVHTFATVHWGKGLRTKLIPSLVAAFAFIFRIVAIVASMATHHTHDGQHSFMEPTPVRSVLLIFHAMTNVASSNQYWCWIAKKHLAKRLGLQYVEMWLAVLVLATLYGYLYVRGRGVMEPIALRAMVA
jgi:hypothetical protein